MTPFWARVTCIIFGCTPGGWLPVAYDEPCVKFYVRQCRRCLEFERRGYLCQDEAPR